MHDIGDIVVVSNLEDPLAKEEDSLLSRALEAYSLTQVADLSDIHASALSHNTAYLFRNIWGREETNQQLKATYEALKEKGIRYLNSFDGKGDQERLYGTGKRYLIRLFEDGYPVIPTFRSLDSALQYPAERYLLKPILGISAKGIRQVTKKELETEVDDPNFIIQPYLDFTSELSFFFINSEFQYALQTKSHRWDLEVYQPSKSELESAERFISWNPISGIQRIDFLRTYDNQMLLLEVEDWCPYLSLFDCENLPRRHFISTLVKAIKNLR